MIPSAFHYERATSVGDALARLAAAGGGGKLIAGGHSLVPLMKLRLSEPSVLIDVARVPGLAGIRETGGRIAIGAGTTHHDVAASPLLRGRCPAVADTAAEIGDPQVRNRGTLGGSAAHADPSAEIPLCLVTLGGEVALASKSRRRVVAAGEFFQGILATAREPDEMITALRWPARKPGDGCAFEEIAQRRGDFAIAAAAATAGVEPDGAIRSLSFGLGGVEDRPVLVDTARFVGAPAARCHTRLAFPRSCQQPAASSAAVSASVSESAAPIRRAASPTSAQCSSTVWVEAPSQVVSPSPAWSVGSGRRSA